MELVIRLTEAFPRMFLLPFLFLHLPLLPKSFKSRNWRRKHQRINPTNSAMSGRSTPPPFHFLFKKRTKGNTQEKKTR